MWNLSEQSSFKQVGSEEDVTNSMKNVSVKFDSSLIF